MRNLVILAFIALFIACLTSQASPNTFKLIEELDEQSCEYTVYFKDTNTAISVDIEIVDISGLKTTERKTFETLQDVIVHFEAGLIEDFFIVKISGNKYMFDRKKKGFGYVYTVMQGDETIKQNANPFNFIKNKLNKKPKQENTKQPVNSDLHQKAMMIMDMKNITGRL